MSVIEFLVVRVIVELTVRIAGRLMAFTQQWIERLRTSSVRWMKLRFMMKYPWNPERRAQAEFAWGWDNLE